MARKNLEIKSLTDVIDYTRRIVPPLEMNMHKGQMGRVGVIGGSESYTGAPYFSAMASARLGCDMSHVICDAIAAPIIKSYSPNLMVHPLLHSGSSSSQHLHPQIYTRTDVETIRSNVENVKKMLPRLHVLVIGPGLGRDKVLLYSCVGIIREAMLQGLSMVIDADALMVLSPDLDQDNDEINGDDDLCGGDGWNSEEERNWHRPSAELINGYKNCVLTPNHNEFERLCKSFKVEANPKMDSRVRELVSLLNGPSIIAKGAEDHIVTLAGTSARITHIGSPKRSGGQGDTLTGLLGTLMAWRMAYHNQLWPEPPNVEPMNEDSTIGLVVMMSSYMTRECAKLAYEEKGRSMLASDLTDKVHEACTNVLGKQK